MDDGKDGGVNDPIQIHRTGPEPEPLLTAEEIMALDKARFSRRMSAGFAIFIAIVSLALLTPLVVFLVRLAAG
jgi:hypothetical protein